jgi:hypothetical protein
MNPQHLKMGVNLEESEKSVMGKSAGGGKKADGDPVRIYTAELNQLAEELGIDLLDDGGEPDKPPARAPPARAPPAPQLRAMGQSGARVTDLIDDLDLNDGESAGGGCDCDEECSERCECECHEECDCDDNCSEGCECACHEEGDEDDEDDDEGGADAEADEDDGADEDDEDDEADEDDEDDEDAGGGRAGAKRYGGAAKAQAPDDGNIDRIISRLEGDLGIKTDGKREGRRNRIAVPLGDPLAPAGRRESGGRVTNEQERRRHINSIVSDIRGETRTSFGVERERIQDIKASKLEQVGQLRMTLEEEGIDCNGVSNLTAESPMEEVDSVLNILRLKNDRNRYSSLAEEVILGFAEGIETVFDGSRSIPLVGWRPDYTGYHNTVNVKLHRMRFETSQVVGNIIQKYNVGATARIVMELLPSFFLYPRQQKKQRGTPGLSSDPRVSDARSAMGSIRASDEMQTLEDVRRI